MHSSEKIYFANQVIISCSNDSYIMVWLQLSSRTKRESTPLARRQRTIGVDVSCVREGNLFTIHLYEADFGVPSSWLMLFFTSDS
jgi:hypothetical protein